MDNARSLTLPQQRLIESGLSALQVARKTACGRKMTRRELASRSRTIERILREGRAGTLLAKRIGAVLDVDSNFLELPRQCWPTTWRGNQGAVETREVAVSTATVSSASDGESGKPRRRASPNRIEVLRLV